MRLIGAALCVALASAAGVAAQTEKRVYKNETDKNKAEVTNKVEVKGGHDIKAVGCLMANPNGGGYVLTDVGKKHMRYALVTDDDMSKYVDHRVQVTGRAADRDGQVKLESTTKVENHEKVGTSGSKDSDSKTTVTRETRGRFLGVKSVTALKGSCH